MIKIGMMIADRYEILEKIGTGGMSDVYKAKDHKLNRFVAVKVLKQEFSENANFVSKFRIEAQAAAGLMHPNIVNVYDVGEEGENHYIVMELVEGITLKKYIEKKARLSVKEAVSIAIQVSMGIEAAHNNHIIHRDIKPQNIIISKEGKVKVTDFGIAKAATSNTITSNVMGSVHYTSPEQARGGYSDEKSDIYSLGVTMFEMLTGRVPFNGETTVAIAIKHIQEEFPSPRDYVPEIPVCVEQIVFKCCQKSPDRRYQSMSELIVDLKQSLISPDEDFVKVTDPDEEASTRMITDRDMVQIKRQSDSRDSMDEAMRLKKDVRDRDHVRSYEDEEDYDPKMEKITTILAVVAALLIGCILIFLVGRTMGVFTFGGEKSPKEQEQETEQVEMIRVVGMHVDEAKRMLLDLELSPEIKYEENSSYDAGTVLRASVQDGLMIDKGTTIVLTVAEAAEGAEVPDATGKSQTEGTALLEKEGFVVNVVESYDPQAEKGMIISQSPEAGTTASAGSSITIRVSQGAEDNKVRVPDVVGMTEMDATVTLTESGLPVGNVTETPHEDPALAGMVCYQSYSVGSYVDKDTPVDLRISTGPSQKTYKYSEGITAPTEDASYQSGMQVTVTLTADDGTQLLNTQTTAFPVGVNYTGIKSAAGTIRFTFTVQTEPITITDPETGETTTEGGGTETKTVERKVNFTEE
jgi:serine/threonine-protein kinase